MMATDGRRTAAPTPPRRRPVVTTAAIVLAYLLVLPWLHPDVFGGVSGRNDLSSALAGNKTSAATGSSTATATSGTGTGGTKGGAPGTPSEPGAPVGIGRPSCQVNNADPNTPPCDSPFTLGPVNDLHLAATGIAPGDRIERALDLTSHTAALRSFTLTTRDARTSALTSSSQYGLQLHIDRCPVAWAATRLAAGGRTYTCPSGAAATTTVLAAGSTPRRGSILTAVPLTGLTVTGRVTTDHLRLTLRLPEDAPLELAGHSTSLTYTFTGTS